MAFRGQNGGGLHCNLVGGPERRRAMVPASQVLETARVRCDQWLQSTPDQRARLEPVYILGDRKPTPEMVKAKIHCKPLASTKYHSLDSEIIGDAWSNCKHVALRPRFSGQHDKLREQSDQAAGWVAANGCSTSQSRQT